MKQKIIVYDLETTSVDAETAIPRIMGYQTSEKPGFHYTTNIAEMIGILHEHDVIVGYNHKNYDNEVLKKFGAQLKYKINIDIMQILHGGGYGNDLGRKGIIITPNGKRLGDVLHRKTLAAATEALGGPSKIGDFDYSMFKVAFDELSHGQQILALEYLKADIDATKYLYEYLEKFFEFFANGGIEIDGHFRPFMRREWIEKKKYLTLSTGSWTYHAVCNIAGVEPIFSDSKEEDTSYEGGFVRFPTVECKSGRIRCKDYTSAYPFAYMMGNLFGRITDGSPGWKGTDVCTTIGTYDDKVLHPFTRVLREIFNQRFRWKQEKDPREYTLKIIINTFYGICGNPAYAQLYDKVVAADCTGLVRQWIKHANDVLTADGYEILYGDTDSLYVYDPFSDDERLDKSVQKHIDKIKSLMNFPQKDFDMSTDDEIQFMMFVKHEQSNEFLKKNYLYVTEDDKLKIKGLRIIKSNCTKLAKLIFDKYIKPELLEKHIYKHPLSKIREWVEYELKKDVNLIATYYKIRDTRDYKNRTSIQYHIANTLGEGDYNIIKLRTKHMKGIGVNSNYIDVKDISDVRIQDIDLSTVEKELAPFTDNVNKKLTEFFSKPKPL